MAKKKSGKIENQINIIHLLRREGPLSRKAIADKIALTRASITQLTTELIEAEILVELGEVEQEGRAGRKEILLDLNETHWYLLGIDIEVDTVNLGICTLRGETQGKLSFPFNVLRSDKNALEEFLSLLEENIRKLIEMTNIDSNKLFSSGIAMVGKQSYYDHYHLVMPPILKKRRQIQSFVESSFRLPVYLENNVRALAMAESLFFSTADSKSFLYVKVGPGLGSAIVTENGLYRGVHGQAGEISQSIVTGFYSQFQHTETVTLEEIISLKFIKSELKPYWNEHQLPYLYQKARGDLEKLKMADIYQALVYKEILIEQLFRKKMRILALRLYDYKCLLDLEKLYLFFSVDASKILKEYLLAEMAIISESLPSSTRMSSIAMENSYLAGAAIAYIENMKKELVFSDD